MDLNPVFFHFSAGMKTPTVLYNYEKLGPTCSVVFRTEK